VKPALPRHQSRAANLWDSSVRMIPSTAASTSSLKACVSPRRGLAPSIYKRHAGDCPRAALRPECRSRVGRRKNEFRAAHRRRSSSCSWRRTGRVPPGSACSPLAAPLAECAACFSCFRAGHAARVHRADGHVGQICNQVNAAAFFRHRRRSSTLPLTQNHESPRNDSIGCHPVPARFAFAEYIPKSAPERTYARLPICLAPRAGNELKAQTTS